MANPNTRETLKQYCLRNLGKPVIEVNASDEQLETELMRLYNISHNITMTVLEEHT